MTGGSVLAAAGWTALVETLPIGIALTLMVAGALRLLKGLAPSTRHTLWLLTLLTVMILPFARGFLAPIRSDSNLPTVPKAPIQGRESAFAFPEETAASAGHPVPGTTVPQSNWAAWMSRSGRLFIPSLPSLAPAAAANLTLLWLGIAVALLLRAGLSLSALLRLKAEGGLLSPSVQEWVSSLLKRRACRRRAHVRSHPALAVPITAGLNSPAVLVPQSMVRRLPEPHLKRVILHETAHILRWDDWMHLLEHLFRALFFFHPAVWWITRRMQLEREMACDDLVVEATGDPQEYARCLVTVAELAGRVRVRFPAPAVSRHPSQLARRITMIVNHPKPFPRAVGALVLTASALFLILALAQCILAPREAQAAVVVSAEATPPPPPAKPQTPVPPALGAPPKSLPTPPPPGKAPEAPKPVDPVEALEPPEPPEPAEPIEPPDPHGHVASHVHTDPHVSIDVEAIHAAVEKAMQSADLQGLDEEEIARQVEHAMKAAEKGMADAQVRMQEVEKQLLAEKARLTATQKELAETEKIFSEKEMEALEAEIEKLGAAIEQKVNARLEGIEWEKLKKDEARALAKERLQGLDEEIKGLTDQIRKLSGQLAAQARLQALPEIEEALKEIRRAQEELKLEIKKEKTP